MQLIVLKSLWNDLSVLWSRAHTKLNYSESFTFNLICEALIARQALDYFSNLQFYWQPNITAMITNRIMCNNIDDENRIENGELRRQASNQKPLSLVLKKLYIQLHNNKFH